MVLRELTLTADPAEWIDLNNFKKLIIHLLSILLVRKEIINILVTLHTCNSSIFFLYCGGNILYQSTDIWRFSLYVLHELKVI